ncbi:rhodanese-like domain-containing protein [Marispirochaeta sp.]|uniref:rhodanese-like domain-containing protein n=1 Tax=Marispirochaeta sp. TaxID=2038653 RepID=UPI0029C7CD09|nr:rhodanese-like domain-containing protein [Marispirochaeta sp.]
MEYKLQKNGILFAIALVGLVSFALLSLYPRETGDSSGFRDPEKLQLLIEEESTPYLLLDVRTPVEYKSGYIPTAENLPLQVIGNNPPAVEKDSLLIVYCRSGNRSAQAKRFLEKEGFTNVVDFGGINRWPFELNR